MKFQSVQALEIHKFSKILPLNQNLSSRAGNITDAQIENNGNIESNKVLNQVAIECRYCGVPFASIKGMKQHIGKIHLTKRKNARCPQCPKRFRHKYAVRFHVNQVHAKTTRVTCELCGKQIYNKYILQDHMKICEKFQLT